MNDPVLVSQALALSGLVSYRRGDYEAAEALLGEAAQNLEALVERLPEARAVLGMALLVHGDTTLAQARFESASHWYTRARDVFRSTGATRG